MNEIMFSPIGTVYTPFRVQEGTPIQSVFGADVRGTVCVLPAFADGLKDLEGFSHIILLYVFNRSQGFQLRCRPYLDTEQRGVFATRAPRRPNPIGLSIVELVGIDGCTLHIRGVDMLDGTPLLDIKPYVDTFDVKTPVKTGWLAQAPDKSQGTADGRFADTEE